MRIRLGRSSWAFQVTMNTRIAVRSVELFKNTPEIREDFFAGLHKGFFIINEENALGAGRDRGVEYCIGSG